MKKTVRDTTLVFATIDRPHAVQRFIYSIRAFFPELPICVADQTEPTAYMRSFYERQRVDVLWVPHDTGVGACRNLLVENTSTPLVFMCDDDLVFTKDTDFAACLDILDHDPEIGIIGGQWLDKWGNWPEVLRPWAIFLDLDRERKTLMGIPAYHFFPQVRHFGVHKYFICDTALNFSFIRRDVFASENVRWDARFKCNGEHEDFYLNFKTASPYKVAFYPGLICRHRRPPAPRYERLRERGEGWRLFMQKWGIEQYCELDNGTRIITDAGKVQPKRNWERYFASVGVVPEEEWGDPRFPVSLTDDMQVVLATHFDRKTGMPARSPRSASSLHLDPSGKLVSTPGDAPADDPRAERERARAEIALAGKHVRIHYRVPAEVRAGDEVFIRVDVTNQGETSIPVGASSAFEGAFRCSFARDGVMTAIDEEATACFADLEPGQVHEQLVRVRAPTAPGIYELSVRLAAGGAVILGEGACALVLVAPRVKDDSPAPGSALFIDSAPPAALPRAAPRGIDWVRRAVRVTPLARLDAAGPESLLVFGVDCAGEAGAAADVLLTHHLLDSAGNGERDDQDGYYAWDVTRQRIGLGAGRQVRAVAVGRSLDPRVAIEVAAVMPDEGYAPLFRAPPPSELRDVLEGRMLGWQ